MAALPADNPYCIIPAAGAPSIRIPRTGQVDSDKVREVLAAMVAAPDMVVNLTHGVSPGTVEILLAHCRDLADVKAIHRQAHDGLEFWRHLPVAHWNDVAPAPSSELMGAVRGITPATRLHLADGLLDEELDRVIELGCGEPPVEVSYHHGVAATAALARRLTPAQAIAMHRGADRVQGVDVLLSALSIEQLAAVMRAVCDGPVDDSPDVYNKAGRSRYCFFARLVLDGHDFERLARGTRPGALFQPWFTGEAEILTAIATMPARFSAARPAVRSWVEAHLASPAALSSRDFLVMWALAIDGAGDPLLGRTAEAFEARKKDFGRKFERAGAGKALGHALHACADRDAVLDALRRGTKSKAVHGVLDLARESLT